MTKLSILRQLIKEEIEDFQNSQPLTFESDPLEYILQKYPSLDATMTDLMTPHYRDYISGVFVTAPKPTTFRVVLHNGQEFYLIYGPKSYTAKVSGKKYYLLNLSEEEFAITSIAQLLELGLPPGSSGPNKPEENQADLQGGAAEEAPAEETAPEEVKEGLNKFTKFTKFRILTEASNRDISANTAKAISFFLSKVDPSLGFKAQSDKKRLGNTKKQSSAEVEAAFTDILQATNINKIQPGVAPNPSGKFTMYEFDTPDFGVVRIIVSGGGNEGEKYEQNFVASAKQLAGTPNEDLPKALQTLYDALDIDNTQLAAKDISFEGGTDTKRDLSFDGPTDIGKKISDITIMYNSNPYYISLKNKSGSGLYSGKNVPFIIMKGDKVVYDASKKDPSSDIGELVDIFNIDEDKVAEGLNNYINKTGTPTTWEPISIETSKFKNFLASSFGYGYYYVKEAKGGDVKVVPILTAEDAEKAVGNITQTFVKYPGPNTKITAVLIKSNSEIFGESQFLVTLRNTQGKLLPLSLRISKL
jgi:hypothetical protein